MRTMGILLPLAVLVILIGGGSAQEKKEADDNAKKIQGTWSVISIEPIDRKIVTDDDIKNFKIVIEGSKLTADFENGTITFKLDPSKKPKQIDLKRAGRDVVLGIYELDGDNLKLCTATSKGDRPTTFATDPDLTRKLLVLKRQK